jgi:hypothetical protein
MLNIKNFGNGLNRRRVLNSLVYTLVFLLIVGGFWFWKNHHKSSQFEVERAAPLTSQFLKDHDYKSYQLQLATYANDDIMRQNYKGAKSILDEIVSKVPSNQIASETYRSYWYMYQQNGDSANRKKYALLTAEKLKKEGQPQAAAVFEQDANGK